jgi:hypothetical protein
LYHGNERWRRVENGESWFCKCFAESGNVEKPFARWERLEIVFVVERIGRILEYLHQDMVGKSLPWWYDTGGIYLDEGGVRERFW